MSKLIVGSIVGNEKNNYLQRWLENVSEYADLHCIIDDCSIDGTEEILKQYYNKGKCVVHRNKTSMFKDNEPQLRNQLWEMIRSHANEGDWVIIVDADEFYVNLKDKKDELMNVDENVIAFRLLDLWNETQYRVDGYWSPYFHRMFRFKDWPFAIEGEGLHKPCVPQWVINSKNVYMSEVRCLHYSYLRDEDKKRKYDFYMKNVKDKFNLNHARSIMEVKPTLKDIDSELPSILITSLLHNREWILPQFLKCLDSINYPKEKIKYCFIVNNNTDNSVEMLRQWSKDNDNCMIIEYNFDKTINGEHKWDNNLIHHMAIMRNQTLNIADKLNVDYMVNIDSDILFDKNVIKHLVTCDKKIISPVFWAGWGSNKKFPQCWDRGGYELSECTLNLFKTRRCISRVGGLGAFTAIHKDVWKAGVNYNRVYNLPSDVFGEDRNMCTRASVLGFKLWASTYYDLIHVDNKEMLEEILLYNKYI